MNRRAFLSLLSLTAAGTALSYYWPQRWNYIVIHHSAGSYGTIEHLQKIHRNRQPWDPVDAMAYHYIIGNGNGLPLGKVATGWRQQWDLWGAHLTAKNLDRNFRGIGICLIGNFDQKPIPPKQYKALLHLTARLMKRYNISLNNVTTHGKTMFERTNCPGRFFPHHSLHKDIQIVLKHS